MKRAVALSVAALGVACADRVVGTRGNTAPVLTVPGPQTVSEGEQLIVAVSASDLDKDALFLTVEGVPPNALFDADKGEVKWTPDYTQEGEYDFLFKVSDGRASAEANVKVTVADTNRAPVFLPPPAASVRERELVNILLAVSDPDGDEIAEITGSGGPFDIAGSDAAVAPITGNATYKARFAWRPSCKDGGTGFTDYEVTFTAKDAKGAGASASTLVSVENQNCAPLVTVSQPAATVPENQPLTLQVTAEDPDGIGILFFTAEGGPLDDSHPEEGAQHHRATFTPAPDSEGGELTWTPGCRDAGVYILTFTAVDRTGKSTEETAGIEVTPIDCALQTSAPATVSGEEATYLEFYASAEDPEQDTPHISWTWDDAPAWAEAEEYPDYPQAGHNEAWVWGTPGCKDSGSHTLTWTFTGTRGRTAGGTTALDIANKDCPPVIDEVVPWTAPVEGGREITLQGQHLIEGTTVKIDGTALDAAEVLSADDSSLTFRAPAKSAPAIVQITVDNHESPSIGGPKKLYYYRLKAIGGADWGLPRALAASSQSENVFAALYSGLFYLSTDAGATWLRRGGYRPQWPGANGREYLAFDAATDETIYSAGGLVWPFTFGSNVWVSTDQARTWRKLPNPPGASMPNLGCALPGDGPPAPYTGLEPAAGGGLYVLVSAGCGGGAWRSPSGTEGWKWLHGSGASALPDPGSLPSYLALASAPSDRNRVMVGADSDLYASTDAGAHWAKTAAAPSGGLLRLAFDPRDGTHLFALTDEGVFESTNFGAAWTKRTALAATTGDLAVARASADTKATVYVAATDGLWASSDNGATVEKEDLSPPAKRLVAATATAASSRKAVALTVPPQLAGEPGVLPMADAALRTSNGGGSWQDASTDLSGAGIQKLVVTKTGDLVVLAGNVTYARPASAPGGRLTPSSTSQIFADLSASSTGDHTVFAIKASNTDKIWRSTDGGASFVDKTPPGSPGYGMMVSSSGGKVHAILDGYPSARWMAKSSDDGDNWTVVSQQYAGDNDIIDSRGARFFLDQANPNYFWFFETRNVGFGASFRWSSDGGTTWKHEDPRARDFLFDTTHLVDRYSTSGATSRLVLIGYCPSFCDWGHAIIMRNANGAAAGFWTEQPTPAPAADFHAYIHRGVVRGFGQARPSSDPNHEKLFFAGSNGGLLVSFDRAVTWKRMYILEEPYGTSAINIEEDPNRPNTFIIGTSNATPGSGSYGAGVWELEIPLP